MKALSKVRLERWAVLSMVLPIALSFVVPWVGQRSAIVYAVLNTAGYWVFITGRRPTSLLSRLARGAAHLALPVGFPLVLFSSGHNVVDHLDRDEAISAQQVKPHLL